MENTDVVYFVKGSTNMTITKICDMLKKELLNNGYEYGFVVNGKKYKPDMSKGFDNEYYQQSLTVYCVQDPSVTMKEKTGTCVDAVLVMKSILDSLNVSSKIWLLYNKKKNKVHTILTFEAESKIIYLELTPQSSKTWYGQEIVYPSEQEFLSTYENCDYDISDVTNMIVVGQRPYFLLTKLT